MVNKFPSNIHKELKNYIYALYDPTNSSDLMPSATEDCADVNSRYERYKNHNKKPQFTPVKHEKPPHY